MESKVSRIKSEYNACAKNFGQYLSDHDMAGYNMRSGSLIQEYGEDIKALLWWFAPKVQALHDEYMTERKQNELGR